ncbi:Testican-3 [Chelonia mydas]|uniref:Testican-3 n=1 Tax=Chelonia mydas TaxID=8469 RepID=M7BL52_CHEMY|nr:Testican-3 [Chelonia mydas]
MKVKELRQAYQQTKEANGLSGSETHTRRFYDQLYAILGGNPTTTPPLSVDTCKGGISRNREEDFVDEEENAQQAGGESVLPGSQDLFITLDPIPSEGGIHNPEAGEDAEGGSLHVRVCSRYSQGLAAAAAAAGGRSDPGNFLDDKQWLTTVSQYDKEVGQWNKFRDASLEVTMQGLTRTMSFAKGHSSKGGSPGRIWLLHR